MVLLASSALAPAGGQAVGVKHGIVYGQGQVNRPAPGAFSLLMDLYRPRGARGLRPALC